MDENKPPRMYFIGKKEDLVQAKRMNVTLDGRDILIIYHQRTFYALDLQCYHAGSSLEPGDIEEINNKLCIVCPKHKYKITLAEGEGLYKATNPAEKVPTPRWYSKGIKQRVHKVTEVDEDIFVTLSNCPGWIESDYYQTEKGRAELRKAQESEDGEADVNADEDV
ncbi:Rieske domain-containing protein [Sinocyclocheilus anshuiensis]|uniref:Rieske domain-containing protein n=1 Tax=Sinocyclocheilus anshuiensis TaxID=1608454 RepID=A0A671QKS8_9TELE|nr:PREDICTED: Rieske domain-containing protein-like [Sinocyclocheilus anshuiensis]XP_016307115.1 PREDICTED: Rieske domain-containing protein-like [Sinocyclocheilus anshuiensis]XP_016307123.1 PREDICTED: Rieske domain-containing protein-like [Sinocyclocheilus anshuiensis]